jgi:hypothetical protein
MGTTDSVMLGWQPCALTGPVRICAGGVGNECLYRDWLIWQLANRVPSANMLLPIVFDRAAFSSTNVPSSATLFDRYRYWSIPNGGYLSN